MPHLMHPDTDPPRTIIYQRTVSPLWAGLLAVPLVLLCVSIAAALLVGGAVAALVLPLVFRARLGRRRDDADAIELRRDQYVQVDDEARHLPPR